ncbi:hypothetical protein ACFL3I_00825 [Pseudomonadota bacterium]
MGIENRFFAERNSPIPLSYFPGVKNVGDGASAIISGFAAKREVFFTRLRQRPHVLSIGSILSSASRNSHIWGTGSMGPDFGTPDIDRKKIYALRGKLTADQLVRAGLAPKKEIAFGDPGFLVRELPEFKALQETIEPEYTLGLVPHYVDYDHPLIRRLMKFEEVMVLDVRKPLMSFMRDLLKCKFIASSSLHGLIFAEAACVPNVWVELSDKIAGAGFKFRDWYSLSNSPKKEAFRPKETACVRDFTERALLHDIRIDSKNLLDSFPKASFRWQHHRTNYPSLTVNECRTRPIPLFICLSNQDMYLKQIISGVRAQNRAIDIIIHYERLGDSRVEQQLSRLCDEGVTVCLAQSASGEFETSSVDQTIRNYFQDWAEPSRFMVTEGNIDFSLLQPDFIDVCDALLDRFPEPGYVGPFVRPTGATEQTPIQNNNDNSITVWLDQHHEVRVTNVHAVLPVAIYRAGSVFSKKNDGLQVVAPYAIHRFTPS